MAVLRSPITHTTHNRIIFVLSLAGIIMAIYVLQSFLRHTGIVCATGGCDAVRKSSASWPLGIPVPAIGLVGYCVLALCAFLRTAKLTTHASTVITNTMLGMATFGVLFVSWFTYTELFVIKGICMWCTISAVNMVVIWVLLLTDPLTYNRGRHT